jgi:opacity protein-like surface antigen
MKRSADIRISNKDNTIMPNIDTKEIGYIGARLREKSTYAGLAVLLGVFLGLYKGHINIDPTALAGALESIGIGIGTLIMIFLPEGSGKAAIGFFIAASVVLLSMDPARAGDMSGPAAIAKAISYTPCQVGTTATPLQCSGFYVGGGLGGQGSNADIIGSGINGSVFAGGITPTIDAGYQYAQGNWLFAAELDIGYTVGTNAKVNGIGNGFNGARISEVVKVGGNLAGLLGTQAPITIPPQLANSILAPYVHVEPTQWQLPGAWANGVASGAGILFDLSPRLFGDLRYTYTNFSAARAGGVTINDDNSLLVTINYKLN